MCWNKLHGFFNIDKPPGITSFDVIRQLKRKLPPRSKLGHLGTLDPMAAGVLPIAAGNATRVIKYIEKSQKEYIASAVLGAVSDTQDAWGNITYSRKKIEIAEEPLQQVLQQFIGTIEQIPPMYSAVHHEGCRLYELARQGMEVKRASRPATILNIELLEIAPAPELPRLTFKVNCSQGTYVRTLVHDIGQVLGTGAYLSSLTRTLSGIFELQQSLALNEIMAARDINEYLLPVDYPLAHLALYALSPDEAHHIMQGRSIKCKIPPDSKRLRLYLNNELRAIARYDHESGALKPETVFTPF